MSRRPLLVLLLGAVCVAPVAAAGPRVVVAFGDSTTAPRGPLAIYARRLRKELPALGIGVRVVNSGLGGNDTGQARARFKRDVLAHRPDLVILQFGINDASVEVWRTPPARAPRVARKDYEANLRALVRTLKDRGITVVLMTPNPMRWTAPLRKLYGKPPYRPEAADGFNVLLKDYAAGARALAREEKVCLVDVYAAFQAHGKVKGQSVEDLLLDGMHPNERGHRLIADLLLARLPALLKKKPQPR